MSFKAQRNPLELRLVFKTSWKLGRPCLDEQNTRDVPSARALPTEFVLQAIPYLGGRPSNPPHKAHEKSCNDVDVTQLAAQTSDTSV
jgi:hypothetical protein